jgi:hypothetical protein
MSTDCRAHPEPEDLTDEAILKTAAKELGYEFSDSWFLTGRNSSPLSTEPLELLNFARAAIAADRARHDRPAVAPVAVAERPWEREGWCDAEGRCWVGRLGFRETIEETGKFFTMPHEWQLEEPELDPVFPCVLLPYWAIPLPTVTQEES